MSTHGNDGFVTSVQVDILAEDDIMNATLSVLESHNKEEIALYAAIEVKAQASDVATFEALGTALGTTYNKTIALYS